MASPITRIKAFAIDYIIILAYIAVLFLVTITVSNIFSLSLQNVSPVKGQLIGFSTLTLPVVLYFTLCESSSNKGTVGKRRMGLQVTTHSGAASLGKLLLRNIIKFLPWELAHFFVFHLVQFTSSNVQPPLWVGIGLIGAQALALLYLLGIFFSKSRRTIYELLSGTQVIKK